MFLHIKVSFRIAFEEITNTIAFCSWFRYMWQKLFIAIKAITALYVCPKIMKPLEVLIQPGHT